MIHRRSWLLTGIKCVLGGRKYFFLQTSPDFCFSEPSLYDTAFLKPRLHWACINQMFRLSRFDRLLTRSLVSLTFILLSVVLEVSQKHSLRPFRQLFSGCQFCSSFWKICNLCFFFFSSSNFFIATSSLKTCVVLHASWKHCIPLFFFFNCGDSVLWVNFLSTSLQIS